MRGLLANFAVVLCHAIAAIFDVKGHVNVTDIMPDAMPPSVKRALSEVLVDPSHGVMNVTRIDPDHPKVKPRWRLSKYGHATESRLRSSAEL